MRVLTSILLFLILATRLEGQSPLGTAFTYQGRLTDGGVPANGVYDLELRLFDAGVAGNQVGSVLLREDINVANGLFSVTMDFGASPFVGDARWLGLGVRPGASTGSFTALSPLQELTPAPMALFASTAAAVNWSNITNKPAGFADDVDNAGVTSVSGAAPLSGTVTSTGSLSLANCAPNQLYKMNGGGTAWVCSADLDTNTTYTVAANSGLTLVGTVLGTDSAAVARKDAAAGNQAFDTSTLFLDYTNNRAGVGTASPGTTWMSTGPRVLRTFHTAPSKRVHTALRA